MSEMDAVNLFTGMVNALKKSAINLHSPLEEMIMKTCGNDLAYIDNRKDAKQIYDFDFWSGFSLDWLKNQGIEKRLLYSESQQFPDFFIQGKEN